MKLLYLINGLGAGGAERSLAELLPFFQDAGIHTTVACLKRRSLGVESDVRLTGCDLTYLDGGSHPAWVRSFRRLVARLRPDLVHTTLFDSHLVGRIGAVGTKTPVLSSLVNTPYLDVRKRDRGMNRWGFRLVRAADRWTARNLTTHFHAITRAVADAYVQSFGLPRSRISVIERGRDPIRLGVPDQRRRERARALLGIPADAEVLINVGRQEFQKGQSLLLEAVSALRKRHPALVLLIAGREGNVTPNLRRLHETLGLGEHVRFLGYRSDIPDLLAASDLFVFPSLFEGLGGAVIEAMALGLPVVASDIPALREVVEDRGNGTLVAPESPAALAGGIEQLLADPGLRARFGARGRELFQQRFAIDRSASRMIRLYRDLCDGTVALDSGELQAEVAR